MGSIEVTSLVRYANNSIINPVIPYTCKLRSLQLGDIVIVRGYVPPKSINFNINLQFDLGNGKADNILHISVRFKEKVIVRNSQIGGKWGSEERQNGLGALKQNQYFECCILVHQDYYKIAFNKQHHCTYRHRCPYGSVNQLHVTGSVQISSLCSQSLPTLNNKPTKAMPPISATKKDLSKKEIGSGDAGEPFLYNIPVPYLHSLPNGLKNGNVIYVCGQPRKVCKSFRVTLKMMSGPVLCELTATFASRTVTCSSIHDGVASPVSSMEQMLHFPFQRGAHFDLLIVCQADRIKISVNNMHVIQLSAYKGELSRVRQLEINGDIKLKTLRMGMA